MTSFENQILLNQIAQGVRPLEAALDKLSSEGPEFRNELWYSLSMMVGQAHPRMEDVEASVASQHLKRTFTPCVLLLKDQSPAQLNRVLSLPPNEDAKVLKLLLGAFVSADNRRRQDCADGCRHWWHRDLGSASVIESLREGGLS